MSVPVQKFAVRCDDGSVTILAFVLRSRGPTPRGGKVDPSTGEWVREPTDENVFYEIERIFAAPGKPRPMGYRPIKDADVPADRTYRDAWTDDGKAIVHDMGKARALHVARLRRRRAPKLVELDGQWMRAMGQGNSQEAARVEAERQALRDLPVTLEFDKIDSVDDLKKAWPENLPR
jgi:hypothetical protein